MRYLIALVLLLLGADAIAQNYGNEWINFDQQYFKFQINEVGLYRISTNQLQSLGIDANPEGLQIWRDGQQVPLYVTADFVEFYAYPNDGVGETELYKHPKDQLRLSRSLITNEASYFLSSGSPGENARIQAIENVLDELPPAEEYFWHEVTKEFENIYYGGIPKRQVFGFELPEWQNLPEECCALESEYNLDLDDCWVESLGPRVYNYTDPYYEAGEGHMSSNYGYNSSTGVDIVLPSSNIYLDGPDCSFWLKVLGRSNAWGQSPDHHVQVLHNGELLSELFLEAYDIDTLSGTIAAAQIEALENGATPFRFEVPQIPGLDEESVGLATALMRYPRNFDLGNFSGLLEISLEDGTETRYLEFANLPPELSTAVLYRASDNTRIETSVEAGLLQFSLSSATSQDLMLFDEQGIFAIEAFEAISFTDFTKQDGDFLIIYPEELYEGAAAYADYRRSFAGGSHQVVLASAEELYNQFVYGTELHPLSIRNLINLAEDKWIQDLQYTLLIGDAIEIVTVKFSPEANYSNLLPSYGHPPSDWMFSSRQHDDHAPQNAIGRIPCVENQQILDYLSKVQQYEQDANCAVEDWKNNMVFSSEYYYSDLQDLMLEFQSELFYDLAAAANLNAYFYKESQECVTLHPDNILEAHTEEGVGMIHVYSSASGTEYAEVKWPKLDLHNYENTKGYPFLLATCRHYGTYAQSVSSIDDLQEESLRQNILAPNGGVIGVIANELIPEYFAAKRIDSVLLKLIYDDEPGISTGEAYRKTIEILMQEEDVKFNHHLFTRNYFGDPSIVINDAAPQREVQIIQGSLETIPEEIDPDLETFELSVSVVENNGLATDLRLIVLRESDGLALAIDTMSLPAGFGETELSVSIDTADTWDESLSIRVVPIMAQECSPANNVVQINIGAPNLCANVPSDLVGYDWLISEVNASNCNCCEYGQVTRYHDGNFEWIYVEPALGCEQEPRLYYDGDLYCTSSPGYSCYLIYGLLSMEAEILWNCGAVIPNPCNCDSSLDPVCGDDGVTYSNTCYANCAGVTYEAGYCLDPDNSLPASYPWLVNEVDQTDCCETAAIYAYDLAGYTFIITESAPAAGCDEPTRMYNTAGQLYCESGYNYDCLELYGLSNGTLIWSCEGGVTPPDPITEYPWLNDLTNGDCCDAGTVLEYDEGFYQWLFVVPDPSCGELTSMYNSDGLLYCTSYPGYDCLTLYGLQNADVSTVYQCSGKTNVSGNSSPADLGTLEVVLYPNPNQGSFQIRVQGTYEQSLIEVYDLRGQQVFRGLVSESESVDLTHLPGAMYIVQIQNGHKRDMQKLMISK